MIPAIKARRFVGEVANHHKTEITNVYDDRYRIDVWTCKSKGLINECSISKSFFVEYDEEIVDKTL